MVDAARTYGCETSIWDKTGVHASKCVKLYTKYWW